MTDRHDPKAPELDGNAHAAALQVLLKELRHDLRGILSPAMLVADRLSNHEDPAVRRAGAVVSRCVDQAAKRLDQTRDPLPAVEPPAILRA